MIKWLFMIQEIIKRAQGAGAIFVGEITSEMNFGHLRTQIEEEGPKKYLAYVNKTLALDTAMLRRGCIVVFPDSMQLGNASYNTLATRTAAYLLQRAKLDAWGSFLKEAVGVKEDDPTIAVRLPTLAEAVWLDWQYFRANKDKCLFQNGATRTTSFLAKQRDALSNNPLLIEDPQAVRQMFQAETNHQELLNLWVGRPFQSDSYYGGLVIDVASPTLVYPYLYAMPVMVVQI